VLGDQDYFYLVLPYIRYGDLFDYVRGQRGGRGLPVFEARSYFSQVRKSTYCCGNCGGGGGGGGDMAVLL